MQTRYVPFKQGAQWAVQEISEWGGSMCAGLLRRKDSLIILYTLEKAERVCKRLNAKYGSS